MLFLFYNGIRKVHSYIRLPTGTPTTTKLSRGVGAASDIASQLYYATHSDIALRAVLTERIPHIIGSDDDLIPVRLTKTHGGFLVKMPFEKILTNFSTRTII